MSDLFESLLSYYGLTKEGYSALMEEPSFLSIPSIAKDPAVLKALSRIELAKERGEKVIVYGDYDCDGVMSTSIMIRALRNYGINAASYLPSRYLDGYGLNLANAKKIAASGYSLVFTVDNGVMAHDGLLYLQEKGIDAIIIDHHEIQGELPPSFALIHPSTLKYGAIPVSAGYLSFLFSCALLKKEDEYLLTLGAISTISDMMPLKSYNRDIVRLALRSLGNAHFPSISEFFEKSHLDEKDLAMDFIPAINAIGRLIEDTSINRLVPYFVEDDPLKRERIANWMKEVNSKRKDLTKSAEMSLSINHDEPAVVVLSDLPEGLNGLLANRLLNEYGKPVCVLSPSKVDPSLLVGSLRSQEGFNVMKALNKLDALLVKSGGHAFAGGVSIKKEDFDAFKRELNFDALKFQINPPKVSRITIDLSQCNMETYKLIRTFAPFGQEWKEPDFLLKGVTTANLTFSKDGKYLSSPLNHGARLFSFRLGASYFADKPAVDLSAKLSLNEYKGRLSLDVIVDRAK